MSLFQIYDKHVNTRERGYVNALCITYFEIVDVVGGWILSRLMSMGSRFNINLFK